MKDPEGLNREIEIKLDLGSFTNYLKLVGFLGELEQEDRQINGFFDTEDQQIAKMGWALRVRAENERGLVTVKGISAAEGLVVIRQEIEADITRGQAIDILNLRMDVMSLTNSPVDFIKEKVGDQSLTQLVKFSNTRQKKTFRIADKGYLFEIDKTEFNDGSVDYELELELEHTGDLATIEDKLRHLFSSLDIPFEHQTQSKFHRALNRSAF